MLALEPHPNRGGQGRGQGTGQADVWAGKAPWDGVRVGIILEKEGVRCLSKQVRWVRETPRTGRRRWGIRVHRKGQFPGPGPNMSQLSFSKAPGVPTSCQHFRVTNPDLLGVYSHITATERQEARIQRLHWGHGHGTGAGQGLCRTASQKL